MEQHNISVIITAVVVTFVMSIIIWKKDLMAHPDGATPYWYPSSWIYGFVDGCAGKIEEQGADGMHPWVNEMWPENIRSICGCTVDALRHGFTFKEVEGDSERVQMMVNVTLPVCIDEEQRRNAVNL